MTTEPRDQASPRGSIPADTFAHRLMLARAHAGHLSIRDAADQCNLGRGAWTNWEKGAKPADIIEIAEVVAEKLGVDFDWLLFGGELAQAEGRPAHRRTRRGREGDTSNSRSAQVIRPVSPVAGYGPFGQKPGGSTRPGSPKRRPMLIGPGRRAM